MLKDIDHPRFSNTSLQVDPGGIFGKANLFLNGNQLQPDENGDYAVADDDGVEATLRLQSVALDPTPKLLIDGYEHDIVDPLEWYEWGWVGLPLALIPVGGCLGGMCGGVAFGINATIFRSTDNPALKWGGSFAVSGIATVIWLVAATALQLAIA